MPSFNIEWTPSPDFIVERYNVYIEYPREDFRKLLGSTRASRFVATGIAKSYEPFRFLIAPVVNGIEASPDQWEETKKYISASVVDLDVPDDITGFEGEQTGSDLLFRWDEIDDPPADYVVEIRMGTTWETGIPIIQVPAHTQFATTPWWASGSTLFWARTRDKHFTYSGNAAGTTIDVQADSDHVEQGSVDESASWGGTKSSVENVSGVLKPVQIPDQDVDTRDYTTLTFPWWYTYEPNGSYITDYVDAGATVREKLEVDLTFDSENVDPGWAENYGPLNPEFVDGVAQTTGVRNWADEVDTAFKLIRGLQIDVYVRTTTDDPSGTPTWSAYRRWIPGAFYTYRAYQIKVVLGMRFPFVIAKLTGFTHKRMRKNWKEEGSATVVTANDGIAITFNVPFSEAPKLSFGPVTADVIPYIDSVSASGATIKIKNTSGTLVTGTVHWHALGV